ncbi:unnamed protein product [Hermetia illucens]|uniref:Potassium channel domain-containing protein n=1 Tax=Hermetia illucens TaxID=343691 RepID=A0A7R8UXJ5_HERIL|nr:unnamed protein product [Hermetia illucens]
MLTAVVHLRCAAFQAVKLRTGKVDCTVCKYDAVNSETKLHGYEFTTVTDREDSCQLIRNSPTKINNMSSTCLQIKTNPVIQQQHQQQHYIVASSEGSSPLKHHLNQSTSPKHYQLIPHPNYRAILNCRGATTESGHELTTNATTYFPITLPANHFACNPANNYNQSPTIKYHGMQLQTPLSHVKGFNPQDPHLHTATVHGIRRGKFLPKPMPQEINMLLAESDLSYRSDAMSNSSEPCTSPNNTTASVDLMEDEEENEQNRSGCPHGTPSRIPLLSSSGKINGMEMENQEIMCDGEGENNKEAALEPCNSPPQVPITIVLFILVSYISIGTVVFSLWENWSIIDGAYFCFVTLSTIGYGDFLPLKTFHGPDIQLFACCAYLLLGLVLVAMSFSILETQLMWKCKRIAVRLKLTKD